MGSKGLTPTAQTTGFTNTTTNTTPNPAASAAYSNVLNTAQQVASTPYQPYTGQLVQGFSPDQLQAFQQVQQMQGMAQPYINSATNDTNQAVAAANPANFNAQSVNQYMSPYQSQVIGATEAQLANTNAQQQSALTGNAIAQGAMGGNRVGVAQAQLGGQQALAENQTIAGLENQGYSQALGEYNQQQAQNVGALQAGAYSLGQLGTEAQNAALQGSQALLNTGSLQQQLGQAQLSTNYQQFLNQQAYPFQVASWESGLVNSTGPNMGGTSNTTGVSQQNQSTAAPTTAAQVAGAGTALAGLIPYSGYQAAGTAASNALGSLGSMLPTFSKGGRIGKDSGGGLDLTGQQVNQINESHWLSPKSGLAASAPEAPTLQGAFADGGRVHKDDGGSLGSLALLPGAGGAAGSASAMPYGGSDPVISAQLISENHPSHWQAPSSGQAAPAQLLQTKAPQNAMSALAGLGSLTPGQKSNIQSNIGGLLGGGSPTNEQTVGAGLYARGGSVRQGFDDGGTAIDPPSAPIPDSVAATTADKSSSGMGDQVAYIRQAATKRGIDPDTAVKVAASEGLHDYVGDNGSSFGPFQLHYGHMAPGGNSVAGLGDDFTAATGKHASDPSTVKDQIDFALDHAAKNGWGAFHGAAKAGLDSMAGVSGGQHNAPGNALAFDDTGAPHNAGLGAISDATTKSPVASAAQAAPEGKSFLDFSPEVRQGLVAAGLGMMASRSPWAGVAIGEGGLKGIGAMQEAQKLSQSGQLGQAQIQNLKSESDVRNRAQNLNERLTNMQIQARQQAAGALGNPTGPYQSAPTTAPALAAPLTNGTNAPPVAGQPAAPPNGPSPAPATTPAPSAPLAPMSDPNFLEQRAKQFEAAGTAALAGGADPTPYFNQSKSFADRAASIRASGTGVDANGKVIALPGFGEAKAGIAAQEATAKEQAVSAFKLVDVQPQPGGPVYKIPQSKLAEFQQNNPNATQVNPGAGTPPGGTVNLPPGSSIAKQPEFIAHRQDAIAKDEGSMVDQYRQRQIAKERLDTLSNLISTYQTGAGAEAKANAVAAARSIGIPIKDSDTANPAAFEQFTKNATANIFDQAKSLGGRILVTELAGLSKANANPNMQPEANRAILGQAKGILSYEDQHFKDYMDWKRQNPNAFDTSAFETQWTDKNPLKPFVESATQGIAAKGMPIPPKEKLKSGDTYIMKDGRPGRWNGSAFEVVR
jgi:hypothetical protein